MVKLVYSPNAIGLAVTKSHGVIKADEVSILDSARLIISAAEKTAEQIMQKAQFDYEAEKHRGYRDGRALADQDAIGRLLSEDVWLDRKLQDLERDLADLVKTSIHKVLDSFDHADLAETMISAAMKRMRHQSHLQIHLPHSLMEAFLPLAAKFEAVFPHVSSVELVPDASLQAPDFILESAIGRIECRLGDKLQELDALIDRAVGTREDELPCKSVEGER